MVHSSASPLPESLTHSCRWSDQTQTGEANGRFKIADMQTVIQRDCHPTAQCFAQVTKGADDPKGSYEFLVQVRGESGRGYELAAAKEVDRSRWMSALQAAKSEWERPNLTQLREN